MIVSIFTKNVASNKVSLAMLYPTFPLSPSGRVLRQKRGGGGGGGEKFLRLFLILCFYVCKEVKYSLCLDNLKIDCLLMF